MSAATAKIKAVGGPKGSRALAKKQKAVVVAAPRRSDYRSAFGGPTTPDQVESILQSSVYGGSRPQNEAFDRMLRDPHINAEYTKRLMAVGRLGWDIRSASQIREGDLSADESALADEIAAYVRAILWRVSVVGHGVHGASKLEAGLAHLDDAIGRGLAGIEAEWDFVQLRIPGSKTRAPKTIRTYAPVRWHLLAPTRWRYDDQEPWRLRLLVDDTDHQGLFLDEQPAGKFILHAPRSLGGSAFRGALHLPAYLVFFAKTYGWNWFLVAVEIFGKPMRIAKVPANATPAEWQAALDMLTLMGDSGAGVFSAQTAVELASSQFTGGGTQSLYERLIKMCDAAVSKNYIGNALTTEMQNTDGGSQNQPTVVADDVREDLRDDDLAKEAATITEQSVKAIVRASPYAAADESLWPAFSRCVPEPQDDVRDMDLIGRGQKVGKKFTAGMIAERFGWPLVGDEKEDTVLEPAAGFDPFGIDAGTPASGGTGERPAKRNALREMACSAMDTILGRGSPMARMIPWVLAAALASQAHSATVIRRFDAALVENGEERIANSENMERTVADLLWPVFLQLPENDLRELSRQTLVAAQLAGRARAQASIRRERPLADEIRFERLPFVEAIENLRDRIGMTPEAFLDLDREARSRAWRVAGVWDLDLLAVLHTNLVRTIAEGGSVRDFRERVLPFMYDRDGWTGEKPWHANLVFFQNMAAAASAGSYRQMAEAGIGHWIFTGYGDSCPICAPEVGKVYRLDDTRHMPPLHFQCDCDKDPVFDHELPRVEISDSASSPNAALDFYRTQRNAYQFDVREYGALEPVPLDRFPEVYRDGLRQMAAERNWSVGAKDE